MSNLPLAKTLQEATNAMIEREFAFFCIPGLKEATRMDHDKKQAILALGKFAQFVRELAEPPMFIPVQERVWRTGELLIYNFRPHVEPERKLIRLETVGFIKPSQEPMYIHPDYDFFVYLVPTDCGNCDWKIDATKTSWRHFFRRFHRHIERQIYEQVELGLQR